LCAAIGAAYWNSLQGPFVFDDPPSIANNATIRHLWPLGALFSPPAGRGLTVEARPLLNFSFAVNYAISGNAVWSYHLVNLLIHLCAALTLFGIVRRTAERFEPGGAAWPTWLALAAAGLWALHPLQTEAVSYVAQRAESLASLFYLLALYGLIRDWRLFSVLSCLLGMGTKEITATAPLVIFLYDRTFLAGSFRRAWADRRGYYMALAGSWIVLAALMLRNGAARSGTAGFGTGVSSAAYAWTQGTAIVHYLRLSLWPHPLVFDYGEWLAGPGTIFALKVVLVMALVAACIWGLRRRPPAGFLGGWFLLTLAPSSSFLPIATQTMAEHRMYLPLAALTIGSVWALAAVGRRLALSAAVLLALGFGCLTVARNRDYRTELRLHADTAAKQPENARAHYNLGTILARLGRDADAAAQFREALRLRPRYADAENNLGNLLLKGAHAAEAIACYRAALEADPGHVAAHYDLGKALVDLGEVNAGIEQYRTAIQLDPLAAEPKAALAGALVLRHELPEAIRLCREALRADPDDADAHYNLANALSESGRPAEAAPEYGEALAAGMTDAKLRYNFGNALADLGRWSEAAEQYRAAIRLNPDYAAAHYNLGTVLASLRRFPEAAAEFAETVRLRPRDADAKDNLRRALRER
jgi:tetratricopeptide (TPR) repeat protein